MFITSKNYIQNISNLINKSDVLSMAVAFWGAGSDSVVSNYAEKPIRIICNLLSGGTNPEPISNFLQMSNVKDKRLDTLHAKVVIGNNGVVVGSANFSTNGLSLDGVESSTWEEAGFITTEQDQIINTQKWFDCLWDASHDITAEDMKTAKKQWASKRNSRLQPLSKDSILDFSAAELKERKIHLVIWQGKSSKEADESFGVKKSSPTQITESTSIDSLSFFEDWEELPADSALISVYCGKKGRVIIDGVWRRIPELDTKINKTTGIQVVLKEESIMEVKFNTKERNKLQQCISPLVRKLWEAQNDGSVIITLHDALYQNNEQF